jgi:uncharacterized protein (TIGR02594 family)
MEIAETYLGVCEMKGDEDNPTILGFYAKAGHPEVKHDEVAWCAAFVGACLNEAGLKGTGTLWAKDYLRWKGGETVSEPEKGDIVIFSRGTDSGHVAFFDSWDSHGNLRCLGGNQHDAVSFALFPKERVLGYRRINYDAA